MPDAYDNRTVSLIAANGWGGLIMIPAVAAIIAPFGWLHGWSAVVSGWWEAILMPFWLVLLVLFASIILHEGLHAVGWMWIGGVKAESIRFGFKTLTPYSHCQASMPARAYRFAVALPALLLGVLPGLIAGITGSGWLMAYGALMLAMASGDLLVLWLIRDVPSGRLVRDHPSEVGCEIHLAPAS